jgi:hypothetical protein
MVMVFNATFNIFSVISWRSVLFGEGSRNTQRKLPTGHLFRLPSPNKTDRHDITEKMLKVALNTITIALNSKRLESHLI